MIQNVAAQDSDFLINKQEPSAKHLSEQKEFGMHGFRHAARAIKGDEFILRGTLEFERISDGFRNQGNVRPRIYKQRNVGFSFGRW
jgi:hypothetical protein